MGGRFALDTDVVIPLLAGDTAVRAKVAAAAKVLIPVVVIGELYYGAENSGRPLENVRRVHEFAAANPVLPCDPEAAREYGRIKALLRAKGRPLPENDIWIAAIALRHGLTLVTRDAHFQSIDGLLIENW